MAVSERRCRYYKNEFPEEGDYVMVQVLRIEGTMGAYVSLLEYDGIEGMILLSELSTRRIRSISKHIRVGKTEVAEVLTVDVDKGYLDLSKKYVTDDDRKQCTLRYEKSRAVHNILHHVSLKSEVPMLKLYETIVWPLYSPHRHAYDALKLIANDQTEILESAQVTFLSDLAQEEFFKVVRKRLKPQDLKLRTDFHLTCYTPAGVNAIRSALAAAESVCVEETLPGTLPIRATLIAPPLYVLTYTCQKRNAGRGLLEEGLKRMRGVIESEGGSLVVKVDPRVVTSRDERNLVEIMESYLEEGKEVDGDELAGDTMGDVDSLGEE